MKNKRTIGAALALTLAAGTLGGCNGGYDALLDRNAPVTVTIWHYYNGVQQTQFDEMVSRFNNTVGSEKGIYVEAFSKNSVSELAAGILASVTDEPGAEPAPDIFATYVETAYRVDKLGKLADLGKYFTDDEKAEYIDEYLEEGTFGDSLVIFPTAKSTEVMMLNVTDWSDFAAAEGLSYEDLATWEGLAEVAEKYYNYTDALTPDVPNDGRAFFGRDAVANYMVIGAKQLGHPFAEADEDGNVTVSADRETVRKLWDNFYVPYVKGYFTAESRFRSDDAKIGSIIALICATTGAAYYPSEVTIGDDASYPIENVVLSVPGFTGRDSYVVQQGAGMSVVKSDEKTEYASAVFLKWFTEEEQNIGFAVNSGYLPVKKSANNYTKITAHEEIGETMLNTFSVAIDEINAYRLYTSPPYDRSAEVRDFVGNSIETSAKEDQTAAWARIDAGEDRQAVLAEYTDDAAFERWFESFNAGLIAAAGQ
ncbi:MAG: extracellular solute-binding protein [Bacteroides sp.]|nr:extracellular solute-binding protein [Eubacterium sp.]MCM1419272.1 extracellular solute-binding protein [Roseburia sp.]MCM1463134.1 extracellular solute-binding protein [Bacteroides sp.]